jgi:hypothetical protein
MVKIVLDFSFSFCYNTVMEKNNRWTDKQVKLLKRFYGELDISEMAIMLEKSPQAIRNKVHYLRRRGWTFNSTRR